MCCIPSDIDSLPFQILLQPLHNLDQILLVQPLHSHLDYAPDRYSLVYSDKASEVHVAEQPHQELAVHPVRDPTMTRYGVAEILDVERAFETRSKESSEWRDDRRKDGKCEGVELHGVQVDRAERDARKGE